jgi:hypothetical protein
VAESQTAIIGGRQAVVNQEEAKEILANQVAELKRISYTEFRSWVLEKKTKRM